MKKRIVKNVAILGLAPLLFFGCRQPAPVAGGHSEDPRTLRITVHSYGLYSVNLGHDDDRTMTADQVRRVMVHRWNRYHGSYPVVILPDQGNVFSNAWGAIEVAAGVGLWRQGIAVEDQVIEISVPARDPGPPRSPVMFRGFKGNAAPEGVELLRVTKEAVELNGKRTEIADIVRHFANRRDKKAPILILPADEAPMTLVGKLLKALSDAGLENTSLSMVLKEAEGDTPPETAETDSSK